MPFRARPGRRSKLALLGGAVALLVLGLVATYFANPLGTASTDLRARLLGTVTYRMGSDAMSPNIRRGYAMTVDATAYRRAEPAIGDILAFRFPRASDGDIHRAARVAAGPGDRLSIRFGEVFVNGELQPLPEGAVAPADPATTPEVAEHTVPEGHYYVLGDNRDGARDSRHWGPVPRRDIVGKVVRVAR